MDAPVHLIRSRAHLGVGSAAPEPGTVSVAGRRRVLLVAVGVTIALHLALLTAQAAAAVLTGSVAIAANALHIGVDTGVHLVALGGVWLATRPADPRHPYGYERYEALASLLIGTLILVAVGLIVSSALPRLADPKPSAATGVGLAIMAHLRRLDRRAWRSTCAGRLDRRRAGCSAPRRFTPRPMRSSR